MGKAELKVEIDEKLAARAKAADLRLDSLLEDAVRSALGEPVTTSSASEADARAEQWAQENEEGIRAYNERIARRGVFGHDLRRW